MNKTKARKKLPMDLVPVDEPLATAQADMQKRWADKDYREKWSKTPKTQSKQGE
jgi:hypothetical protein